MPDRRVGTCTFDSTTSNGGAGDRRRASRALGARAPSTDGRFAFLVPARADVEAGAIGVDHAGEGAGLECDDIVPTGTEFSTAELPQLVYRSRPQVDCDRTVVKDRALPRWWWLVGWNSGVRQDKPLVYQLNAELVGVAAPYNALASEGEASTGESSITIEWNQIVSIPHRSRNQRHSV